MGDDDDSMRSKSETSELTSVCVCVGNMMLSNLVVVGIIEVRNLIHMYDTGHIIIF